MMDSRKKEQNIIDKRGTTNKDLVGFQKAPTYKTPYKVISKTLKSEIFIFLLMQETVVLFKRIFRGSPSFFSRTITKENSLYREENLWSTFREFFEGHRLPSLEGHKTESSEK
jgi:hypothetical protein